MLENQCRAYLKLKESKKARQVLEQWQHSLAGSKTTELVEQQITSLAANQLLAGQDTAAGVTVQRISDLPAKLGALNYAKEEVLREGSKERGGEVGKFIRAQISDDSPVPMRITSLSLAADAYYEGSDRENARLCVEEAVKLSTQGGNRYHAELAAMLAEHRDFERAWQITNDIDDSAERAIPLSELARRVTQAACDQKLAAGIAERKNKFPKTKLVRIPK